METQAHAVGPAIRLDETYRPIWGFIPHFVHVPFYVYAYAFGDLVNASGRSMPVLKAMLTKWRLCSGIRRCCVPAAHVAMMTWHRSALMPVDMGFWSLGLDMLAGMIDELEGLDLEEGRTWLKKRQALAAASGAMPG